jgi:hypothetical protein
VRRRVSSGLGVLAVGGLLSVVGWLVLRSPRREVASGRPAATQTGAADHTDPSRAGIDAGQRQPTAQEIVQAVKAAPLLQQREAAARYRGMRVRWSGTVVAASKLSDDAIKVQATTGSTTPAIFFTLDPRRNDSRVLNAGDSFTLEGRIGDIQPLWIDLVDVRVVDEPR